MQRSLFKTAQEGGNGLKSVKFRVRAYSELAMSPRIRPLDGKKQTQRQNKGSACVYIGVLKLWAYPSNVHRQCMWEVSGALTAGVGGL